MNIAVKERYNDWISSTIHALTPAGRIKRPFYSTVATWVKESWDDVDEDLIRRSFKCCGVSTNTDDDEENEYTEENDYENEWEIETDKGKSKENNGGNDSSGEDGNQNQELTSDEE
ncbi:unnamed protein product [Rhizophagus irregularis]|nr:unnamed protein product [Rhizophagus irregularis]